MSTVSVPRLTPGMTLAVESDDYLYGAGMALLIVKSISVDQEMLSKLEWVLIHCTRLRHDGAVLEAEFAPLIRTAALAAAVRPTGWLPSIGEAHASALERRHG
jgi:hypothetical protein